MSTKPTKLPRWASVTPPSPDPGAGKQDVGWVTGERPPAQYSNWLAYWNYKWAEYLNDGNLQGAHTFDSTVGVTGLLTASAGITVGSNQNVTVSGTGDYKHGDRELSVPSIIGLPSVRSDFLINNDGCWFTNTSGTSTLYIPIPLRQGDRIKSATWHFNQVNITSSITSYSVGYVTATAGGYTVIAGMSGSIAAPIPTNTYTLTPSSPYTLGTREAAMAKFVGVGTNINIGNISITYDRP